jgi:hypothetical protein
METAWVKEGKLVMRRAANPQMGVEVKGAVGTDQLQFRPVRFGTAGAKGDRATIGQSRHYGARTSTSFTNRCRQRKAILRLTR